MFALKYRDGSSKGSSQRCHSRQGKELQLLRQKAAIICRRDCAGLSVLHPSPKVWWCQETLGSKHSPREASIKAHVCFNQTAPSVFADKPLISTLCVLGEGLGLLWAAAGGSAPWQQWMSLSHSMAQLWFPPLPGQMPPDRGSGV